MQPSKWKSLCNVPIMALIKLFVLQWCLYWNESSALSSSTEHISSPATPWGQPLGKAHQSLGNSRTLCRGGETLERKVGPVVLSAIPRPQQHHWELVTNTNLRAPRERYRISNWIRCVWGRVKVGQKSAIYSAPNPGESDAGELLRWAEKKLSSSKPTLNPGGVEVGHVFFLK